MRQKRECNFSAKRRAEAPIWPLTGLECGMSDFEGKTEAQKSGLGRLFGLAGQDQRHLLHVLTRRREQALRLHFGQAPETGIAMPVQLLGVGKAAFNGFLAGRVEAFAQIGQPMGVDLLLEVLPEVARDELLGVLALGAAGTLRALAALAGSAKLP